MCPFCVVILEPKRKVIVPQKWCKIIENDFAIIFYSPNKNAIANFENVHRNFHFKEDRSYYGHILQKFGEFCSL